ncbi:MAG: VPLPA-CTERM sorting domain-containing protein [Pseudomonadota bacterium]
MKHITRAIGLAIAMIAGAPIATSALTVTNLDYQRPSRNVPIDPPNVGTLDVGGNLIGGALQGPCRGLRPDLIYVDCQDTSFRKRLDIFRFTVAEGTQVTDMYVISAGTGPDQLGVRGSLFSQTPSNDIEGYRLDLLNRIPIQFQPRGTNPGDIETSFDVVADVGPSPLAPLQAGIYWYDITIVDGFFEQGFFGPNATADDSVDYFVGWNVGFQVEALPSAVPLPASAPLILGGLGLLSVLGRRRKR